MSTEKERKRNVLSLDLSSKSSGWCVAIDKTMVDYGCISCCARDVIQRIYIMRDSVIEIIKKYDINEVIIEEVHPDFKNLHTIKVLLWLQAAIVFGITDYNRNIEINFILPSEWRASLGIKGNSKRSIAKQQDINHVKEKFGIEVNDDIADSICIMDSYLNHPKQIKF